MRLEERFKEKLRIYLNRLIEEKIMFRITSDYRTYEEQAELYAKDPSRVAPPGTSYHEKGRAIDIVFATEKEKQIAISIAIAMGFWVRGYDTHIHIDDRFRKEEGGKGFNIGLMSVFLISLWLYIREKEREGVMNGL